MYYVIAYIKNQRIYKLLEITEVSTDVIQYNNERKQFQNKNVFKRYHLM